MKTLSQKTTKKEQEIAINSAVQFKNISKFLANKGEEVIEIKIQDTEIQIAIPLSALSLLSAILTNMAEGKSITVLPTDSEVSTQQAADLLNVSRPYFIKLLEQGKLPYRKIGRHRRVLLKDLIVYEKEQEENRETQLRFLAKQAQDLNLGYE